MSKAKSMAKVSAKGVFNIFWGLATSSIISAVGVMLVAGILSEGEYGLVAIVLIGPNFIAIFRDWGVDWATIKYTAQYRAENKEENVKNVLASVIFFEIILGFSLSVFSFFLSGFFATNIFDRPDIMPLIQIASFTIFADALLKAAQTAFTGYEKMEYYSITSIVFSTLKTSFMVLLVFFGLGTFGAVIGVTIAYLISGAISIIILYVVIYKNLHKQEGSKLELLATIKMMFKYGLPLSISSILSGFLAQFYNFLIAIYCTDLIIGNYQLALNFLIIVTLFYIPITKVLFPVFSKINSQKEPEILRRVFQFSVKYAALLIVPVAFTIITISEPVVSTLFGAKYSYTPLYLALSAITFIFTAAGDLSAENVIKSQGKTDVNLKLALISSVIGLALNLVLIPRFGVLGLLVTGITSGIPSLIIALWWINKKFNATIDWISSVKIVLASALATILSFVLTSQLNIAGWITLALRSLIFLASYSITTPLIGAINKTDIQYFRELLKGLAPLDIIFSLPLYIIERLTKVFQRS